MEMIILLLEGAVKEYRRGSVELADKYVAIVAKVRQLPTIKKQIEPSNN